MKDIITGILRREGWDKFTNDPVDRGGATKWGITQRAWDAYLKKRGLVSTSVQYIVEATARKFYADEYVIGPNFDEIKDPLLLEFVVDSGVNHGTARAARWLQAAVGAEPDGVIGRLTLGFVAKQNPLALVITLVAIRQRFYVNVVRADSSQAKFLAGWTVRVMEFLDKVAARLVAG